MTTAFGSEQLDDMKGDLARNFERRVEAMLKLGIEQFGLPVGIFSAISAETYEVRQVFHPENALQAGQTFTLDETFCAHVIAANDVLGFHDINKLEENASPAGDNFGFVSYLGAPVRVDGECVGTIAFGSPTACDPFSAHDKALISVFSDSLGQALAHIRDRNELLRLAMIDSLTGLYNRRHMESLLRTELERANRYENPVVIGMVDFDNLKSVNENYGYDVGDAALQMFAKVSSEMMRETDIIGRWGDKEFLILMPETGAAGALNYLQRLTDRVREADFLVSGQQLHITLSIGLGMAEQGDTITDLVSRANSAMLESKEAG
jgi:diguanylate cyclase (GGDEF)-like protein